MPLPNVFKWLQDFDDDEMPDGAWRAKLEEAVLIYNEEYGTHHDPYETWLEYCLLQSQQI